MYFNVFTCNVIGILLLHSHYNVFAMRTHLYICFSLSTMIFFPTCFTTTLYSPVPIDPFQLLYNLWKYHTPILAFLTYTSHPHISYSTFYVVNGCVKHHGAMRSPSTIILKFNDNFTISLNGIKSTWYFFHF
jgi:hypothetical protein